MEVDLTEVNNVGVPVKGTSDCKKDTKLTAFFDGSHRWVVYQTVRVDDDETEVSKIRIQCCDAEDGK